MKKKFLALVMLGLTGRNLPALCLLPDNGGGTINLPVMCDYELAQGEAPMQIVDGLPAATTIEIVPLWNGFNTITRTPVLPPGSEQQNFLGVLSLQLTGTGTLAGFSHNVTINMAAQTGSAAHALGTPQDFATDLMTWQGQIVGDPHFDLLRITGGTNFGMPSPGAVHLESQPGSQWATESFFDVTYRIDFIGAPGGALAGRSGSTTAARVLDVGPIPEPCSPALLALGVLAGLRRRR